MDQRQLKSLTFKKYHLNTKPRLIEETQIVLLYLPTESIGHEHAKLDFVNANALNINIREIFTTNK